jgi:hypothetical protein
MKELEGNNNRAVIPRRRDSLRQREIQETGADRENIWETERESMADCSV